MRRKLEWATAHFHSVLGHDTTNCIVTQLGRGVQQGAMIRSAALLHGPMTWPARVQGRAVARARSLASEVCRDTNDCIVTGGAGLASRHGALGAAIRRPAPYDTEQERCDTRDRGFWLQYNFCIVTGGGDHTAV